LILKSDDIVDGLYLDIRPRDAGGHKEAQAKPSLAVRALGYKDAGFGRMGFTITIIKQDENLCAIDARSFGRGGVVD